MSPLKAVPLTSEERVSWKSSPAEGEDQWLVLYDELEGEVNLCR